MKSAYCKTCVYKNTDQYEEPCSLCNPQEEYEAAQEQKHERD